MNRPKSLITVPAGLLKVGGSLFGKRDEIERLVGSLQVDIEYTQKKLEWTPPVATREGLLQMARWYASETELR